MNKNKYLSVIILTFIVLGFGTAGAQQDLAQQAYTIFQKKSNAFTEDLIIDHTALIASGTVVPGNPDGSEIFYIGATRSTPIRLRSSI